MINVRSFETIDQLIDATEKLLRETLNTAGHLMLSGGSTPYTIYNRIAATPCPINPERKLFLSDERMQPFDSELNNAHNLAPLLTALNCKDQFIRVNTALSSSNAATHFENELKSIPRTDLGLLGMGADGHTAGFFTPEQARRNEGPLTLHTDRPDGMKGVSITPAFIQRIDRIILLVTGESKREIINTLLTQPETIAAGIALNNHPNTELWTDLAL